MTLYGFYTDESGNNGFGDMRNQPVLCYAGVLVPINYQVYLHNEIQKIKDNLEKDIKAKIHGIPIDQFSNIEFFKKFEIHGKAFIDGEDFYYNLSDSERFKAVEDLLSLASDTELKIVAALTNKQLYQNKTRDTNHNKMHILTYTELVRCISSEIAASDSYAFIICDDGKPSEINNFCDALRNPANNRVYPDLQIKLSHDKNCNLIQLADMINFITSVYFRNAYGFQARKRHNTQIIDFYERYLSSKIIKWEYR
ncbi:DUF3800 domain-containing protein [Paenibacillus xylanexedens]|uniref:DUF3800 domain-containing protein n=1 Tax=Paenibacillus xylanexedens TaxID=528191 RepID=UPI0011A873D9|nr:DUF3800 domain-containing protein [Paenibacillus xylanexedens]